MLQDFFRASHQLLIQLPSGVIRARPDSEGESDRAPVTRRGADDTSSSRTEVSRVERLGAPLLLFLVYRGATSRSPAVSGSDTTDSSIGVRLERKRQSFKEKPIRRRANRSVDSSELSSDDGGARVQLKSSRRTARRRRGSASPIHSGSDTEPLLNVPLPNVKGPRRRYRQSRQKRVNRHEKDFDSSNGSSREGVGLRKRTIGVGRGVNSEDVALVVRTSIRTATASLERSLEDSSLVKPPKPQSTRSRRRQQHARGESPVSVAPNGFASEEAAAFTLGSPLSNRVSAALRDAFERELSDARALLRNGAIEALLRWIGSHGRLVAAAVKASAANKEMNSGPPLSSVSLARIARSLAVLRISTGDGADIGQFLRRSGINSGDSEADGADSKRSSRPTSSVPNDHRDHRRLRGGEAKEIIPRSSRPKQNRQLPSFEAFVDGDESDSSLADSDVIGSVTVGPRHFVLGCSIFYTTATAASDRKSPLINFSQNPPPSPGLVPATLLRVLFMDARVQLRRRLLSGFSLDDMRTLEQA